MFYAIVQWIRGPGFESRCFQEFIPLDHIGKKNRLLFGQSFGLEVDDCLHDLPSEASKRHIYGNYGINKKN